MKKKLALIVLSSLFAISLQAASTASDNASNSPYQPGNMWPDASNGGTGFGAWSFFTSGNAGRYIGSTGVNQDPSFGIYAGDSTNSSSADRPFTGALVTGQKFTVQLGATGVGGGGEVGLNLLDGGTPVFTFKFVGGATFWQLNDGGSDFDTNIPFSGNTPISFSFKYNGGSSYDIVITQGATTYSGLGYMSNSVITNITGVRFFSNAQGGGENLGFNNLAIPGGAPVPTSAVSRKTHTGVGDFDIPLPLTPPVGIECRQGGATNDYQMVVTFPASVTVTSTSVNSGTGSISSATGSGTNTITVNLTGVTDQQTITIGLNGVSDGVGTGNVAIPMGVLIGDTNGNGTVNAGDTTQTRGRSGQTADATNFRSDVNTSGVVNSGDQIAVRSRAGNFLP